MAHSKASLSSTIEIYQHQKRPVEHRTQVYKKDTNTILDLTVDAIYVHLYALFPWYIILTFRTNMHIPQPLDISTYF